MRPRPARAIAGVHLGGAGIHSKVGAVCPPRTRRLGGLGTPRPSCPAYLSFLETGLALPGCSCVVGPSAGVQGAWLSPLCTGGLHRALALCLDCRFRGYPGLRFCVPNAFSSLEYTEICKDDCLPRRASLAVSSDWQCAWKKHPQGFLCDLCVWSEVTVWILSST